MNELEEMLARIEFERRMCYDEDYSPNKGDISFSVMIEKFGKESSEVVKCLRSFLVNEYGFPVVHALDAISAYHISALKKEVAALANHTLKGRCGYIGFEGDAAKRVLATL